MTTSPSAKLPGGIEGPGPPALICSGCDTANNLLVEAIEAVNPAAPGFVSIQYSCSDCGSFYAHAASVQQVAELLNAGATAPGVLQFGRYFIHCGEPMEDIAAGVSHLGPPAGSQGSASAAISIGTRQLRCRCGFQLDAPL
ncbi:hypothetical protein [Arthrobacter wenxiniae]|uniref:Uncharacterized protein n=1 Tax=Arthrobacter wenxiniae TaxID=2713570 RepID=A0A7Y7LZA0_9MICC|nr:hypothetical protein [Arthrobacter wenxiniae]NVM95767.1 hypothetical protein [Arthrobacter wenxiniae]